ncbi:hypothetical protein ACLOJK_008358 [Asimina triloba]
MWPEDPNSHVPLKITGDVELEDVVFAYPSRPNTLILNGFSLSMEAGKSIASVGGNIEMESSSVSSKSQGMLKRKCICGLPTVILTSNTIRNPGRQFFRCMHYQDPSRNCNFFRWLDEGRNSRSDATTNSGSDARSHIQKHEKIISDFGELLHCVTALKEAHLAETVDWKLKHKALKEEVRGLKEAGLRRDMEASIMKKNQSAVGLLSSAAPSDWTVGIV